MTEKNEPIKKWPRLGWRLLCQGIGLSVLSAGCWFFLIPGVTVGWYLLFDQGLHGDGVSTFAYSRHRLLSDDYAEYCRDRVSSDKAESLQVGQIAETEWPLFGSVFYLWATESLQEAWEKNPELSEQAPKVYAREAVEAATALVLDPGHAKWVKDHWGEGEYLTRENVFYRMLVISAIVSHHHLTGSEEHFDILREQSNGLADELDRSEYGLLDDYPGECYPSDVVAAVGAIQRADEVLKEDHTDMIQRAIRIGSGEMAEPYGLPPYRANSVTGQRFDDSRGCGNSYLTTFAPRVWPDAHQRWYSSYEEHFWQENGFAAGFREFARGAEDDGGYYFDVDAGPVFGGLGTAATSFGIGAARVNGRFDHASTLSYEMVAASWPLANGTLLFPRLFSNPDHAPYIGEVSILFQLSRQPVDPDRAVHNRGRILGCVWLMLLGYMILSWLSIRWGWRLLRGKKW